MGRDSGVIESTYKTQSNDIEHAASELSESLRAYAFINPYQMRKPARIYKPTLLKHTSTQRVKRTGANDIKDDQIDHGVGAVGIVSAARNAFAGTTPLTSRYNHAVGRIERR